MQEKSEKKLESLARRELERKLDYQTRRDELDSANAENEKTDYFERSYNDKKLEILSEIERARGIVNRAEVAEHFDRVFKDILSLQKYVAASNIFLRTYDIKVYQQGIQELTNKAKELELELLPKKKFGFKNKKSDAKFTKATPKTNGKVLIIDILDTTYCGFKNESDKTLTLINTEIFKKDVTLHNLTNCTVRIFGTPSTLHMNNLINCTVLSGPVSTSIFADNCKKCTLVISCQQLRLHSSTQIDIYLHVTSRAIMEDCNQIFLAPYNLSYDSIDDDFIASGLDKTVNHWECVDDFNWLNVERKSPHWSVLKEDNRVCDWRDSIG